MSGRRRKSSNNRKVIVNNKITRCKSKMIPVFERETCESFLKKEHTDPNNICRNCKHSF